MSCAGAGGNGSWTGPIFVGVIGAGGSVRVQLAGNASSHLAAATRGIRGGCCEEDGDGERGSRPTWPQRSID